MDEYRFTAEGEIEDGPMWSSPEEERTFRRVRDLLMLLNDGGTAGLTLERVEAGWQVGYMRGMGGGDIATAPSLDQALQAAIAIESTTTA